MQKSGLTYEGILRQAGMTSTGKYSDLVYYSILKDEWKNK